MRFACVGDDPAARPWLSAFVAAGYQQQQLAWEQLLIDRSLDAVLIAGDSDEVQSAAKQLAAERRPLLILPSVEWGVATAYELSLIRDDSGVVLLPAFAHRGDAELQELSNRLRSGELGTVRRLQIEIELPASESGSGLLSEACIESAALADVDLLRWLGGNYDQVTSLRSGQSDQGSSQATLTLSGHGLPDATWIARHGYQRSWRLTIESDRGTTTVSRTVGESPDANFSAVVDQLAKACRGEAYSPDWSDAVRAFDVLDAARRSLRRRRTIDLHFETLSERQQFKTQMTAMGCGLLVLTLILMLGLLGLGAVFDADDRSVRDARSAGLVILANEFESDSATVSPKSEARIDSMAERMKLDLTSAFVEPTDNPPDSKLDEHRRSELAKRLTERGVEAADHRTRIAPVRSAVWETVLRVLRVAWILPLVVFLALQLLLFVAKPAAESSHEH